jgi:PAT family beta-lactamase induction signal transducer AmpG
MGMGGAGVLFLTTIVGFQMTFLIVALAILLITSRVAVPLREPPGPPRAARFGSPLRAIAREIGVFIRDAGFAFVSSRRAFVAIFLAALPMGAYGLSLALQSNLAVELGLDDHAVGSLSLIATILSAASCILGGWLSDRFGRRRTLALFIFGTTLPTSALAIAMYHFGWIMPITPDAPGRPIPPVELVSFFRAMVFTYAVCQGLMYGIGTAIFMDVTTPAVAATQFTAYMALCNLATSYSAVWQGHAVTRWGYPLTLGLDCVIGLIGLCCLPLMGVATRTTARRLRTA